MVSCSFQTIKRVNISYELVHTCTETVLIMHLDQCSYRLNE